MIEDNIFILKNSTIITTLINIIVEAINVETTYRSLFLGSFLLDSVIDAVTAVDEINQPIAPEAIILPFSQITLDIIYHAYEIPAIRTTKNHKPYGFKNERVNIELFISFEYHNDHNKSAIENFSFGNNGRITIDITANFIVLCNSSELTFFVIFSINGFEERIKVRIIDSIIAIWANQIITKTQRKKCNNCGNFCS